MTANASVSDAGVFLSVAFAHIDAANNAAAPQAVSTHARMNSPFSCEKRSRKIITLDAQRGCGARRSVAARLPLAMSGAQRTARQTGRRPLQLTLRQRNASRRFATSGTPSPVP